jgi:hypothetical protein
MPAHSRLIFVKLHLLGALCTYGHCWRVQSFPPETCSVTNTAYELLFFGRVYHIIRRRLWTGFCRLPRPANCQNPEIVALVINPVKAIEFVEKTMPLSTERQNRVLGIFCLLLVDIAANCHGLADNEEDLEIDEMVFEMLNFERLPTRSED